MTRSLLIYGASGHGKVVADAARAAGWGVAGWADDDDGKKGRELAGSPVLAIGVDQAAKFAKAQAYQVVVAIGDNASRRNIYIALEEAGAILATIVHPSAVLASSAILGSGTVILAGAVVNPDSNIGRNVIVNTSASVDHDNDVGDHVHISPGATLGGSVRVAEGGHVGIGATVRNGISIGRWSIVGAGAVVVRDIESRVVAYGVPARVVRPV